MHQVIALTAVNENPIYRSFIEYFTSNWSFDHIIPKVLDLTAEQELALPSDLVPTANQAQIIRLLYPALFPDKLFLLCDIDIAAVSVRYFRNLTSLPIKPTEILNFSSDAYPGSSRKPICYYFGYGSAFSAVTGVVDSGSLKEAMIDWWRQGSGWATDEVVFGQLIEHAVVNRKITFRGINRGWSNGVAVRRLDRSQRLNVIPEGDPIDAHLARPISEAADMLKAVQHFRGIAQASMTRYISFSLWGTDATYNQGGIANAETLLNLLPDWKMVVFHPQDHDKVVLQALKLSGVRTVEVRGGNHMRMFWRFLASDFPETSHVLFRDCDSRIGIRERKMIFEWIRSQKTFHIIRDHPAHFKPMLGGMWGIKPNRNLNIQNAIEHYQKQGSSTSKYDDDQAFLAKVIFPRTKGNSLVHDEFFDNTDNVPERDGLEFVGQRIDANGVPEKRHLDELFAWERLKKIPQIRESLRSRRPMFTPNP